MTANQPLPRAPKRTIRRSRDGFEYCLEEDSWTVSNGENFHFATHLQLKCIIEYKEMLSNFLETHSPTYCRNIHQFVRNYLNATNASTFNEKSLSQFRSELGDSGEHLVGHIKAFLLQWEAWGYNGVSEQLADWLEEQKIRGNIKGKAVRTQCPYSGAFSAVERAAILEWASDDFRDGGLSPDAYAALYLVATTGQRSVQYCGLKSKDLDVTAEPGIHGEHENFFINLPRAKQRNAQFRSALVQIPVNDAIYLVAAHLRDLNFQKLNSLVMPGEQFTRKEFEEFPLFPYWKRVRDLVDGGAGAKARLLSSLRERPPELHMHRGEFYQYYFRREITKRCPVISEVTGEPLLISPRRFRYTFGTSCARKGLRGIYLAAALTHSDTQNIECYVENTAEQSALIDELMNGPLNVVAQALAGTLVDTEADAVRGDDPRFRVKNDQLKNVGTCGSFEFCASGYRSCYTCRRFQPWLDAPHKEVLDEIQTERRVMVKAGCSDLVIQSSDRLILAVGKVIELCELRTAELAAAVNSEEPCDG
ncbi:MAG: site-specific integrase [Candidatus Thiodiazotropha endolucinida]